MRIATCRWAGTRRLEKLSDEGETILPLALGGRAPVVRAQAQIEAISAGILPAPNNIVAIGAPLDAGGEPRALNCCRGNRVCIELDRIGVLEDLVH